jgi:hypothetical protein
MYKETFKYVRRSRVYVKKSKKSKFEDMCAYTYVQAEGQRSNKQSKDTRKGFGATSHYTFQLSLMALSGPAWRIQNFFPHFLEPL